MLAPLVVLGFSLTSAFVVLNQEAVGEIGDAEKGLASGIFETAAHLFGGAVAVAVYATVIAATAATGDDPARYRPAFATAAVLAVAGVGLNVARPRPARPAASTADGDRRSR